MENFARYGFLSHLNLWLRVSVSLWYSKHIGCWHQTWLGVDRAFIPGRPC